MEALASRIDWKPQYHPYQALAFQDTRRFLVIACGRRFGKTTGTSLHLCEHGIENPGKTAWWIAPTYALATVAKEIFLQIIPRDLIRRATRFEITLINGFRIQYRSSQKPENLVADKLSIVVFDEAGYMESRIFDDFVRPTLADMKGRAIFIGSPRGKSTAFYRWWLRGYDVGEAEWGAYRFPTWYNPLIERDECRKAARDLPNALYVQNWGARWLDSFATVFNADAVASMMRPMMRGHPRTGRYYITAADLAKHVDYTVIVTYDLETRMPVYLQRFQKHGWTWTLNKIKEQAAKFPGEVWVDATGVGDAIYDFLDDAGCNVRPYVFTNPSKGILIEHYITAIENGRIYIPGDGRWGPTYVQEHLAFEYDVSPKGAVLYQAPSEQHDDCVMAGALAHYGLMGSPTMLSGPALVG